ncbi:2-amino-4-hydroxy-6-hydroxymethyldihydropteridine diphosphokinase [Vibrio hippocampi]|uniref:2-amino-4-hydroxy-6-hydroxymethyldihydropteridine diphosphokinase n=1 Tax=Vibrio hippocampi TaxID=654686 RepID=A0ABN8DJG3_9VIBR|nr:2-amino-4-hydroxy-6-hydroxymethyldihydropteridine diphosphokinase [Vibrio hippocampi]CAH0526891.1 2-amino-4-hydroxy-6-hydroxymethyldihydropteridinepyrophosphokinase [Vibrio hippocampi]
MTIAYIGIGSNVERDKHITAACIELAKVSDDLQCSPVYACAPFGFQGDDFYNLVVKIDTQMSLQKLNSVLKEIEVKWGRSIEAEKFQDRTLDLDILLFGNMISQIKPIVPRPDIFKYSFVIQPLYDLAPNLVIPQDGRTVEQILNAVSEPVALTKINFNFHSVSID